MTMRILTYKNQPAGIYIMRVRLSDGMEYSQRIIKE